MSASSDLKHNVIPCEQADAADYDNLRHNLRLVPGLTAIVLLSDDGIALCGYGLDPAQVQTVAAAISGLASLANGLSTPVEGGSVLHTNVTMQNRHLIITTCGDGSILAVYTSDRESLGLAMRETVRVARAFGRQMGVDARADSRVTG
jgi:predicted regulator of Ras-like GTPase activity (Roadblock/LC7/MglB family)